MTITVVQDDCNSKKNSELVNHRHIVISSSSKHVNFKRCRFNEFVKFFDYHSPVKNFFNMFYCKQQIDIGLKNHNSNNGQMGRVTGNLAPMCPI